MSSELTPTHGYAHIGFPKVKGEALSVRSIGGGKILKIDTPATAWPLANAQAFCRWLHAGYRIAGWGALEWDDGPEFEISALVA